jgi:hypothetical protein
LDYKTFFPVAKTPEALMSVIAVGVEKVHFPKTR